MGEEGGGEVGDGVRVSCGWEEEERGRAEGIDRERRRRKAGSGRPGLTQNLLFWGWPIYNNLQ